jgi:isoleucyl-tRNA synthetase
MSTKFTEYKGLDLPAAASEVLDFWKQENIFEKSITSREGSEPFVFFEGPPSANGLPGIHHVMARAIKDIFCRYKTQKGFQVKRKAGWDTHGLPVDRERAWHHEGRHREENFRRGIQRGLQTHGHALYRRLERPYRKNGVLGRYGPSVHHL